MIGLEKVFDFLISLLSICEDFKVLSRFMQKWIPTTACSDRGLHRILSSYKELYKENKKIVYS